MFSACGKEKEWPQDITLWKPHLECWILLRELYLLGNLQTEVFPTENSEMGMVPKPFHMRKQWRNGRSLPWKTDIITGVKSVTSSDEGIVHSLFVCLGSEITQEIILLRMVFVCYSCQLTSNMGPAGICPPPSRLTDNHCVTPLGPESSVSFFSQNTPLHHCLSLWILPWISPALQSLCHPGTSFLKPLCTSSSQPPHGCPNNPCFIDWGTNRSY